MGQEARCLAECGANRGEGKALLETSELLFRGPFRLRIPFSGITSLEAAGGKLAVSFNGDRVIFQLGPLAEKWAAKIRNPPTRARKLGIKPGVRVHLVGKFEAGFREELAANGAVIARKDLDILFYAASVSADLETIPEPARALWIVYPKGVKAITENQVLAAGLVDIKVASFSPTHTALKFVAPRQ